MLGKVVKPAVLAGWPFSFLASSGENGPHSFGGEPLLTGPRRIAPSQALGIDDRGGAG